MRGRKEEAGTTARNSAAQARGRTLVAALPDGDPVVAAARAHTLLRAVALWRGSLAATAPALVVAAVEEQAQEQEQEQEQQEGAPHALAATVHQLAPGVVRVCVPLRPAGAPPLSCCAVLAHLNAALSLALLGHGRGRGRRPHALKCQ